MRSGTIALLLGILLAQRLPALGDEASVQFLPLAVLLAVASPRSRLAALFLSGFLWAVFRAHLAVAEILPAGLEGLDLVASGRVVGVPVSGPRRTRFEFDVDTLAHPDPSPQAAALPARPAPEFSARVRLSWYGAPAIRAGERWRLTLRLRAPRGYANRGGFDYERWLFLRGLRATGYVRDPGGSRRLDPGSPWNLDRWRQRVAESIIAALPGRERAGIIAALAVGVRGHVDREHWTVFRDTGTAHLMAISGLHVGLVAALAFALVRLLWSLSYHACLAVPAQRAAAAASLAAAVAYAAMAGFSLPTQRAVIMIGVMLWCLNRNRATAFSVALCAALAAVVVIDPFSVLGPSLWLSFMAVAVLAFGMMHRRGDTGRSLCALWWRWGRAQYLATLGLAPVLLASFGQMPLLSPLANALAIPWTAFLLVPGAIAGAVLTAAWPQAGEPVLAASAYLLELLWPALDVLAKSDVMIAPPGLPTPAVIAAAAVGVFVLILPRGFPGRWLGIIWMLPLIGLAAPAPPQGALWFTLLDVGHGLATVARTRHHTLVFDAGPRYAGGFDAGAAIVAPYLRARGVSRADRLIISHGDNDHAGGLQGLLAKVQTGSVLGGAGPGGTCRAGMQWRWDGYDFVVLHPPDGGAFEGNDASCVLRISGPGGSILIAADIEARAEQRLTARYGGALASDYLIAPHHGSRTSSTPAFIARVAPSVVLFSAGDRRRPRLPDASVVERYRAAGARIFNTAETGAVRILLDPGGGPAEIFLERGHRRRYWHRDPVAPSASAAAAADGAR